MISSDPIIYNRLLDSFMGGYTHSNYFYTDRILKNIDSYDFASSYPYVMLSEKYPCTPFKKCNIKKLSDISSNFAYIITIKLYNVKDNYYNHIISQSKCKELYNARYDNGRVISSDYLIITVTDMDLRQIVRFYSFTKYEILEAYISHKQYLPRVFYDFILEKYQDKTKLKGVKEKKLLYNLAKNRFNSLYRYDGN